MRILIATDGSEQAAIASELGRNVASAVQDEVRFVGVLPPASDLIGAGWPGAVAIDPEPVERAAREQLEGVLRQEVDRTPADNQPTAVVLRGRPAEEIVAEAEAFGAELIVVGSRGRGALAATLLGSVSEEVIDRATVPVLVARRPEIRRVLVAVDASAASTAAVDFLAEHEAFRRLEACAVGVASTEFGWWVGLTDGDASSIQAAADAHETERREERAAASEAAARLGRAGLSVAVRQPTGDVTEEITSTAAELAVDTIVVGTHGRTGMSRLLMGSVSRGVLHHTGCSVLVVHGAEPPAAGPPSHSDEESAGLRAGESKEHTMKILLAYDGQEPAKRALETAASIAKVMGATIDVISVVPVHPGRSPIDPWDDRTVHTAELEDARTRLANLGVTCRVLEPAGSPAEEIETAVKDGGYDMVVVGSRRQGALGRMLQGSVSEHVATHAEATVVIAR